MDAEILVRYSEQKTHELEQPYLDEFESNVCFGRASQNHKHGITCTQLLADPRLPKELLIDMCTWVARFGLPAYVTLQTNEHEEQYSLDVFYSQDTLQDLLFFVLCQCRFLSYQFCTEEASQCLTYAEYMQHAQFDPNEILHTPCRIGDPFSKHSMITPSIKEQYAYWNTGLIFTGPPLYQHDGAFRSSITINKIRESQQP